MINDVLKKIKSLGYWEIVFRPTVFDKERISPLPLCSKLVQEASINLRGWDYPHIDKNGHKSKNDHIESFTDWEGYVELWRMYQSGQFVHYLALREDRYEEREFFSDPRLNNIRPGSILSIVGLIYQMTELFEFFKRLAGSGFYYEGADVQIGLKNTKNRKIEILEPGRGPLFHDYICSEEELSYEKEYSESDIIGNSESIALDVIMWFCHRFNWENPPKNVFENDQNIFLKRQGQ